jgi:predicted SprT family Zn-dependent metalloprotease
VSDECNVIEVMGSEQAAEPTADSSAGDAQSNENWNVHSNHGNRNVHSNDAVADADGNTPTQKTAAQLQALYDHLKLSLFENNLPNCSKLPDCLITYQRRNRSYGYFAPDRFGQKDGQLTAEIALNPQHIAERTIEEVISTLAREMVSLWQHHFGEKKPARVGYHNKEWADAMESIGLIPSTTGKEGGKRTGDHVSHYIKAGGPLALAVEKLLATGFTITWCEVPATRVSAGSEDGGDTGSQSGKRTKFTCPDCGRNAWGKADLNLFCGYHGEKPKMLPADSSPAPSAP